MSVKVVLSADPERTVTIPILTADQNGATAADYTGVPAQVVFNSRRHREDAELRRRSTTLSTTTASRFSSRWAPSGTGVTEGTHDSTVVSITDDDDPAVTASFEQGVLFGGRGSVSIKVVLSADPERTVDRPDPHR